MPTVSVIVPVYNAEKYLHRCLDSILAQTFTDFELILVDDGSEDNSRVVCNEYAQKDGRVRVLFKENGGVSTARNLGLSVARGKWISFVDSDDYIAENLYEAVLSLQEKYQADIIEFRIANITGELPVIKSNNSEYTDVCFSGVEMIPRIYQSCLGGSVYPCNKLFRAELFAEICFMEGRNCEDTLIMPQLYYAADKVAVTNQVLYYYFQTENSIMRSAFTLKKLDAIYAYQKNREFYLEHNLGEALEWHDATYVFLLLRMIDKVNEVYGKIEEYKVLVNAFRKMYPVFMRNRRINIRQKSFIWAKKLFLK